MSELDQWMESRKRVTDYARAERNYGFYCGLISGIAIGVILVTLLVRFA